MVDDALTLVSWRTRPRSFVALMALYESNYLRLKRLVGSLESLTGEYRSHVAGDCDLVLRVTERCPYTTSFTLSYVLPGDPAEFPDMRVRVYRDARLVEALEWADAQPLGVLKALRAGAERELDQRWARNMMLNKWLEYCLERGHRCFSVPEVVPAS